MTKGCVYCGQENFGEGMVICRGCGYPLAMGPAGDMCETMAIAEAVNGQTRGQIVFAGPREESAQLVLFPHGLRNCGAVYREFLRRAV
jgi:hypothetical protein